MTRKLSLLLLMFSVLLGGRSAAQAPAPAGRGAAPGGVVLEPRLSCRPKCCRIGAWPSAFMLHKLGRFRCISSLEETV